MKYGHCSERRERRGASQAAARTAETGAPATSIRPVIRGKPDSEEVVSWLSKYTPELLTYYCGNLLSRK